MPRPSVGDRELDLLRYVAEHGPVSVGRASEEFGAARDLARSTVLTMMERLRAKGLVSRRRVDGVYRYTSPTGPREVLRGAVESFVETTLGGSLSPVVAYLADAADAAEVGADELAELEELVERLQARRTRDDGEGGAAR